MATGIENADGDAVLIYDPDEAYDTACLRPLVDALAPADRKRLGDVPALIAKLEADALALREHAHDPVVAQAVFGVGGNPLALRIPQLERPSGHGLQGQLGPVRGGALGADREGGSQRLRDDA